MSTARTWRTVSTSSVQTEQIAEHIGLSLRGSELIELISDLGGGKTTFVRGLARGMGSTDMVRSPSFTLCNEYKTAQLTLLHFDFYRLREPGTLQDELTEVLTDPHKVTVIEWADIIQNVLPEVRLSVTIKTTRETERQLSFDYPPALGYLFEGNY